MGMTIDKAKSVINELKLYVEDLHSYSADDVSETLEFVIKALEQKSYKSEARRWKRRYLDLKQRVFKLEEQTRWIPCSEMLPKADEYIGDVAKYYLVQNEYGDILVARYTHGEYWEQIYQLKPIADKIIAWMPLPQPYKIDSEWGSIGNNTDLETVPTNLQDWLSTFNTDSATECYTAVQRLKERMNE